MTMPTEPVVFAGAEIRRFGRWTVLREAAPTANRNRRVECQCDCGTVRVVQLRHLRDGRNCSRSCGCLQRELASEVLRARNLRVTMAPVGEKFGRLTVLREADRAGRYRRVECRCDCGAIKVLPLRYLRDGGTRSCGCLGRH